MDKYFEISNITSFFTDVPSYQGIPKKTSSNNKKSSIWMQYFLPNSEYGQVTFDFRIEGKTEKATFDYKYNSSNQDMCYIEIRYSNPKLQTLIENNPKMMENIDSQIRNMIEKRRLSGCKTSK